MVIRGRELPCGGLGTSPPGPRVPILTRGTEILQTMQQGQEITNIYQALNIFHYSKCFVLVIKFSS